MLAAPATTTGPRSHGVGRRASSPQPRSPLVRLLAGHRQGASCGYRASAAAPGADVQANREEHAWCQLSGAGCVLISQAFLLPAVPGFGSSTFTFPTASWVVPEGRASPSCQEGLVAAPWACGWQGGPGSLLGTEEHSTLVAHGSAFGRCV